MDFNLITSNSTGDFIGAVVFLFAAVDAVVSVIFDRFRGGSLQGFGEVK